MCFTHFLQFLLIHVCNQVYYVTFTFAELYIKQSLHVGNAETFKPELNLGHATYCAALRCEVTAFSWKYHATTTAITTTYVITALITFFQLVDDFQLYVPKIVFLKVTQPFSLVFQSCDNFQLSVPNFEILKITGVKKIKDGVTLHAYLMSGNINMRLLLAPL